ncbi:hypothetical protein HOF40_04295 [Candidatus Parcubacteria bacterium]|jgi:hypothetical protein|nr:hypothetical protein [Candidatus Parcubacteria bacterium]MBT3949283.1 hypothetical protein [Candidatus Parcubacteria bacterium]
MNRIGNPEGEVTEAVVQERIGQATKDLGFIEKHDYMLPESTDALGSKTYWLTLKNGLEASPQFGSGHPVTEEAGRIFDVLDNGGRIKESTLHGFKDLANQLPVARAA